jgi:hypothetical protein
MADKKKRMTIYRCTVSLHRSITGVEFHSKELVISGGISLALTAI